MARTYPKRVFCIEGNWEEKLSQNATVKPALDLIGINELQRFSTTRRGLEAAERSIREVSRALSGRLGFRMVYL